MELPFDNGILEMFKGVGGPMVPGIHGVVCMPNPGDDVVDTITKIRDMCDDLLNRMVDKEVSDEKENSDEFQGRSEKRESESKEQDGQEQEQKERL